MHQFETGGHIIERLESRTLLSASYKLLDVPNYEWYYGCTPSAIGMIMGYWDGHGFGNLIPGDASAQTQAVLDTIAGPAHRTAGAENKPIKWGGKYHGFGDWRNSASYPDHATNPQSIADFIKTIDAWTRPADLVTGMNAFLRDRGYAGWTVAGESYADFTWSDLVANINAGRPMLALVDYNASGNVGHAAPIIGYNSTTREYAVHSMSATEPEVSWFGFGPVTKGVMYGIHSVRTLVPPQPKVRISALNSWALENGHDATIKVSRVGGADFALKVQLGTSGTALSGIDYTALPKSVTIPAGQASVTFSVHAIPDKLVEKSESLVLTITPSTRYTATVYSSTRVTVFD